LLERLSMQKKLTINVDKLESADAQMAKDKKREEV
jgi:hypothetical protein